MKININRGPIVNGKDFNFFQKVEVNNSTFNTNCDIFIGFPTRSVMILLEDSGTVEYSFNGNTLHGDMDSGQATKGLVFDNRIVTKMWFRLASGSSGPITVRIEAWG
jgi:hypothetical protein